MKVAYLTNSGVIGVSVGTVDPSTISLPQLLYGMANLLNANGFPKVGQPYFLAQIMFESHDESSAIARDDNNYSGIRYINKPYQIATASTKHPGFAHFASPGAWATDYKRILSLNAGKGRPIDATSAQQFYEALNANRYFTEKEADQYRTGFNATLRKVNEALAALQTQSAKQVQAMEQGTTVNTGNWNAWDTFQDKLNNIPTWEKWAGGALLALLVFKAIEK